MFFVKLLIISFYFFAPIVNALTPAIAKIIDGMNPTSITDCQAIKLQFNIWITHTCIDSIENPVLSISPEDAIVYQKVDQKTLTLCLHKGENSHGYYEEAYCNYFPINKQKIIQPNHGGSWRLLIERDSIYSSEYGSFPSDLSGMKMYSMQIKQSNEMRLPNLDEAFVSIGYEKDGKEQNVSNQYQVNRRYQDNNHSHFMDMLPYDNRATSLGKQGSALIGVKCTRNGEVIKNFANAALFGMVTRSLQDHHIEVLSFDNSHSNALLKKLNSLLGEPVYFFDQATINNNPTGSYLTPETDIHTAIVRGGHIMMQNNYVYPHKEKLIIKSPTRTTTIHHSLFIFLIKQQLITTQQVVT